jgi:uncharacterized protein DUF6498
LKDLARRLLPILGMNAIPVIGVFLGGWDGATALTVYWWENLVGSLLVAARLVLHRRMTRKRGYERLHLSLESRNPPGSEPVWKSGRIGKIEREGSFLNEFLLCACAASAVHGVVLWFIVARVLAERADRTSLWHGVLGVAAFQVLAFLWDLRGLGERSFAWALVQAQDSVNRVTLIHLVLLVGMWVTLRSGGGTFFGPFAVLKALADVGNALSRVGVTADFDVSPPWLTRTMNRLGPKNADFGEYWLALKAEQRRLAEQDEQRSERGGRRRKRRR